MLLAPLLIMGPINTYEAKMHLSRLVERATHGEKFVIAKAGKPMVKLAGLDAPSPGQVRRVGFLRGQFEVPDDFDELDREAIRAMFEGE